MFLEVLRETVIDSLKLLPFLFAAYLAIEFIEDRAEEKTVALVHRAGRWGPVFGAALGVIPQCGFSAATANLYAGGIITRGTLLAVFLSTSDEMLPILLSSSAPVSLILKLLGYKALAGILLGVTVDTVASKLGYERKKSIHEMCEQEHCHCEDGIFRSALRHTLKIFAFLFVVTFVLNLLVEAVGPETLGAFVLNRPVIGELLGGIIGFIPNCAASVVLTTLYLEGAMSGGARVLMKRDENGQLLEPFEEVVVDVDEEFSGTVVEKLGQRKAELVEMIPSQIGNKVRLIFNAPSRGLIGYHSEFLTDTRGTGIMNRIFKDYEPYKGEIDSRRNGVLISSENGTAIAYSLWKLQDRGPMFIDANVPVYVGMIIGEHTKSNDLEVNPTKSKQLTNIRAAGKDEAIDLIPPRKLSLEQALSYIQEDELLEVTPKTLRLRKRILDPIARKRAKPEVMA